MSNAIQIQTRRQNRDGLAPAAEAKQVELLESEVARLQGVISQLRQRAENDDLTGLLRRGEFFRRLDNVVSQRAGDISVILLDIDDFKRINDSEGHVVGDHVLQRVAKVIRRCLRAGAEVGRFGGEEFMVAFPANQAMAGALAEALRRRIQREVNVTVSVGVATARAANWEVRKMVGKADEALYQAKHAGKNRVCLAA